ncbi:MAG: tetratricopeptide repeat protein [Ktedonobacterales bacterium]|nr:tetratricopeptide repeat protein [Ktedonobacterales bacterium]
MARRTPLVRDGWLYEYRETAYPGKPTLVESVDWFAWLASHHAFRVESPTGAFLARKERRAGGWYWYAYRRLAGRLHTAYLGLAAEISAARLQAIMELLASDAASLPTVWEGPKHVASPELADVTVPYALPRPLTALLGRTQELATATALVLRPDVQLVSMVGTAGVGKTRLACQVAADLQGQFVDGVYFVALAAVHEPAQVAEAVAQTVGLSMQGKQPPLERLKTALREKQCLLLLDNFEQVIDAAPVLAELLAACPTVKLLVTSREVLHLQAEQQFSVPPLALPDRRQMPNVETVARVASVALFVQRAQAHSPNFQLTANNVAAITEICRRLDGVPLAIELAAARIKLFAPQALLDRLTQRLPMLTDGAHDLPERQRSLRRTIEWSYVLLSPAEQHLLQHLAVFAGGCQMAAAEALCEMAGDATLPTLAGITALIDKSLLYCTQQDAGEPRLAMLETIREYALECLTASGAGDAARWAHARYYLALAEEAHTALSAVQPDQTWFVRLHREEANLRTAMEWLLEQGERGGSMEPALRLGGALERYWLPHGFGAVEVQTMQRALQGRATASPTVQAKALFSAGHLAYSANDITGTQTIAQELYVHCQAQGDQRGRARALYLLGSVALIQHEVREAFRCYEEGLALRRAANATEGIAWSLLDLGNAARAIGEYARAQAYLDESLARFHQIHHALGPARVLDLLGQLHFEQGHFHQARGCFAASYQIFHDLDIKRGIWNSAYFLGRVALYQQEAGLARHYGEESRARWLAYAGQENSWSLWLLTQAAVAQADDAALAAFLERLLVIGYAKHDRQCLYWAVDGGAHRALAQGHAAGAVRLWGMAAALRETADPIALAPTRSMAALPGAVPHTTAPMAHEQAAYERALATARRKLGNAAFTSLFAEGRALSFIHLTLQDLLPTFPSPLRPAAPPAGLTARELDVLRLLAQGLTSAQMAEHLVLGLVTVNSHIRSIYRKLGVTSRSAATRYAIDHQVH